MLSIIYWIVRDMGSCEISSNWNDSSRSLAVIRSDTVRYAMYTFLLAFNRIWNYVCIFDKRYFTVFVDATCLLAVIVSINFIATKSTRMWFLFSSSSLTHFKEIISSVIRNRNGIGLYATKNWLYCFNENIDLNAWLGLALSSALDIRPERPVGWSLVIDE